MKDPNDEPIRLARFARWLSMAWKEGKSYSQAEQDLHYSDLDVVVSMKGLSY